MNEILSYFPQILQSIPCVRSFLFIYFCTPNTPEYQPIKKSFPQFGSLTSSSQSIAGIQLNDLTPSRCTLVRCFFKIAARQLLTFRLWPDSSHLQNLHQLRNQFVRCRVFTDCTSPRGTLVVKNALKGTCKRQWTTIKTAAAAKGVSHWSRRWLRVQVHSSHEHRRGAKRPHTTSDQTAWITVWSASKHNATTTRPNASPPGIPIKISDHQNHSFSLPFSLTHSSSTEVLARRLIGTCA